MVRKLGSLKGKTKRKTGFIDLGNDIVLPLRNLSITEDRAVQLTGNAVIPKRIRPASQEEKDILTAHDPSYNTKTYPMISEYNVESDEYQDYMAKREKYQQLLNTIKYVDMDYEIEEGVTLWDDLGIDRGNWDAVCAYFGDELCITEQDLSDIFVQVKKLQGESVFVQLEKLKKLSGKSIFEILRLLEKVELDETLEKEYIEKIITE